MMINTQIQPRPYQLLKPGERRIVNTSVAEFLDYVAIKRIKVDTKLSREMLSSGKRSARLKRGK